MAIADSEWRLLKEKLEVLNGERGAAGFPQAALRRAQFTDVQRIVGEIKLAADALKKAIVQIRADVEALQGDVLELGQRITELQSALDELEAQLGTIQEDITALGGQISDLEARAAEIETELGQASGDIVEIKAELTDTTARSNANQSAITALDLRVDTLEADMFAAQGAIATAQSDITALQSDLADLQSDVTAIDNAVAAIKTNVGAVAIPALTATPVTGTVTDAQYNALLADVTSMRTALVNIKAAITT